MIRKLNWNNGRAVTPFGDYAVFRHTVGKNRFYDCLFGSQWMGKHLRLRDAHAAAQADFERRVKQCLEVGAMHNEIDAWLACDRDDGTQRFFVWEEPEDGGSHFYGEFLCHTSGHAIKPGECRPVRLRVEVICA